MSCKLLGNKGGIIHEGEDLFLLSRKSKSCPRLFKKFTETAKLYDACHITVDVRKECAFAAGLTSAFIFHGEFSSHRRKATSIYQSISDWNSFDQRLGTSY